eukprot:TRINITY_DN134_c0_g5_i1.p1 TRINITY_DN134_c0_g5~~TRINITY_DN134_c0_g5_i1.p1  ORF type:complete len:167 (+),score=6.62 TRINITY_DN134_c0_g5_i1:167-667(+)
MTCERSWGNIKSSVYYPQVPLIQSVVTQPQSAVQQTGHPLSIQVAVTTFTTSYRSSPPTGTIHNINAVLSNPPMLVNVQFNTSIPPKPLSSSTSSTMVADSDLATSPNCPAPTNMANSLQIGQQANNLPPIQQFTPVNTRRKRTRIDNINGTRQMHKAALGTLMIT